jgi:hypothetical protein
VPDISKNIRIDKETVIQNIAYKNKFAIDIFKSTLKEISEKIIRKMEKMDKGEEEINNKSYSKYTYIGKRSSYFTEI